MSRFILMIGLALLTLSILSIFLLNNLLPLPGHIEREAATTTIAKETGSCACGGGGIPIFTPISEVEPSSILVAYNIPKKMDINTSDVVSLKLGAYPAIPLNSNSAATIGTSVDLEADLREYCAKREGIQFEEDSYNANTCRALAKLSDIFGPKYQIFASAYLVANNLDVHLLSSEEQTLDQPLVEWNWNIAPKASGMQTIDIDIEFEWKSISNVSGSTAIVRQVWNVDERIEVSQPWVELGQISFIPFIIAALGGSFTLVAPFYDIWEKRQEKKKAEQAKVIDKEQQEVVLREYIDRISELLLKENLRGAAEDAEVRRIACADTLTVLSRLGAERKGSVLQFLYGSGLVEKVEHIIDLRGADLRQANLNNTNLHQINLREVDLSQADLSNADLGEADLSGANLSRANLLRTNFSGANLSHVDLGGAYWRKERLKLIHIMMDSLNFNAGEAISSSIYKKILLSLKKRGMVRDDVVRDALLQLEAQRQSKLRETYPSGINLSKTDLSGANLNGADLSGTDLTEAYLQDAIVINNEELEKWVSLLQDAIILDNSVGKPQPILEHGVLMQEQLADLPKKRSVPTAAPLRHTNTSALSHELQRTLDAYRNGYTTSRSIALVLGYKRTKASELLQQLKARNLINT